MLPLKKLYFCTSDIKITTGDRWKPVKIKKKKNSKENFFYRKNPVKLTKNERKEITYKTVNSNGIQLLIIN